MKYRKKPVVIEAFKWTGDKDQQPVPEWAIQAVIDRRIRVACRDEGGVGMWIETLEGRMEASPGDFIIRGVEGEIYPCKPDIFEATYERVDD